MMKEIIFIGLFYLSFLGYMFWGQLKTGWKFEIMPVLVICGHVLLLYIGGLLNILFLSSVILFVVGIILLASLFYYKNMRIQSTIKASINFFYVFSMVFFLSWFFSREKMFSRWDEFSHWGLVFKTMLLTDTLPTASSSVYALSYPVGTNLYQYYAAKIVMGFQATAIFTLADESNAYFGNYLFLSLPLFTLLYNVRRESLFYLLPLIFGCFFLNFLGHSNRAVDGYTFYSLYPDGLLGILFGAGLILVMANREGYTIKNVIPLSIIGSTLTLVKPVGIVFSILLILPAAYWILQRLRKRGISSWLAKLRTNQLLLLYSGLFFFFIVLPFLTYFSWSWHVKSLNVHLTGALNSNLSREISTKIQTLRSFEKSDDNDVLSFARQMVPLSERTVVRQFGRAFSDRLIGFSGLTTTKLVLVYLLLTAICFLWTRGKRGKFIAVNIFILTGFVAYNLFLLFLYLYLFGTEGYSIPSFERYISSYLLGWGIFIFYNLFQPVAAMESQAWDRRTISALILTTWIICIPIVVTPNGYLNATLPMPGERRQARALAEEFAAAMKPNSRVYHIMQGYPGGLYHYIVRLELVPHYTQFDGWSLGRRYDKTDNFTKNYRPNEWLALLKDEKYDYVLITHADKQFWSTYGDLFIGQTEVDIPQLFKVGDQKLIRIK